MATEADTCRTFVLPKLYAAGWTDELIPAAELLANGGNLDRKNPRAKEDITHLPPEQLAASILEKEQRIAAIMGRIRELLEKTP